MTDTPAERAAESIWGRLRRRKVVQWGLGYIAGAWALLQGIAFFADVFGWPHQSKRIGSLLLLVGLPIVLVLAWYHGDRGQQRISRPELGWLVVLAVLGGGVLWFFGSRGPTVTATSPTATLSPPASTTATSTDARPSIAVLPFENRSDVQKDAYFVDGIHDDILTQLSKVSALRVISRTSVEQFRDTKLPMKAIAGRLGVTRILEGGVQRAGDRVRINVQLIDTATDAHLWAERYDRELTVANIFEMQSEIATAIAGALQASFTAGEQARVNAIPTQSLEAWQAYQLGKQQMSNRTTETLTEAERHFRSAISSDPKFALAWAGLADTLALQTFYSGRPKVPALGEAEEAAARALELDPNLAEAWASAGNIALNRLQFEAAEAKLRRAIAINPNYPPAHHWLSMALAALGRRNEALAAAEHAVVLDPLSAIINTWLGDARASVGRFDEALAAYRQAIEINPGMAAPYWTTGNVHAYGLGRFDTAATWYETAATVDPGDTELPALVALVYWDLGDYAEAGRWLDRSLAMGEATAFTSWVAALLSLDRGDQASARRHAQKAGELEPLNLYLLRDHDLRKGDYATARDRYRKAFPKLFEKELPNFEERDAYAAIDLAVVLQHTGEGEQSKALLDRSETYFRTIPRMGPLGYGISDVAIHALRGDTANALVRLREAEQAGWRSRWRYARAYDPNLASIRNEPEFKAVFADIERDMARQRAALAARPKDAPLDLAATGA